MDPQNSYLDDEILNAGTGNYADLHPNKILINGDPLRPIDMVERISPQHPAAVPPESSRTTVLLSGTTREARAFNIKQTSAKCTDSNNDSTPDAFELNPWARGQKTTTDVSMYHARYELSWRWIEPTTKLSLQRLATNDKDEESSQYMIPDIMNPLSHRTVPVALDPMCDKMKPFGWNTFDGIEIAQFVTWDPLKEWWHPTFETSEDMMKAIHVHGLQRDGEEEAAYKKINNPNHALDELPIPIYRITMVTLANILARRTVRNKDGILRCASGKRPVPHDAMMLEWFIPEFDNLDEHAENRQLQAYYFDKGHWAPVPDVVPNTTTPIPLFYTNTQAYGHPSEWRWRLRKDWLLRWNYAKHEAYKGELHHELLIRPVEMNWESTITNRGMKKLEAVAQLCMGLEKSQADRRTGVDVLRTSRPNLFRHSTWNEILLKYGNADGDLEPRKSYLINLLRKVRVDIEDERNEQSRRIFARVAKLSDSGAEEFDIFVDTLRH